MQVSPGAAPGALERVIRVLNAGPRDGQATPVYDVPVGPIGGARRTRKRASAASAPQRRAAAHSIAAEKPTESHKNAASETRMMCGPRNSKNVCRPEPGGA